MRIGVFGGTFNPVHEGHLWLMRRCWEELGLEKVLMIPTALPPHKQTEQAPSAAARLEMCRLAVRDLPFVEVSAMEIDRGGKSYTVDTLYALKAAYPEDELVLLVGSDMFYTLPDWKRAAEIFRLVSIAAAAREEGEREAMFRQKTRLWQLGARAVVLSAPPLAVSSTEVRAGRGDAVPPAVQEYISQNGLYGREKRLGYDLDALTQFVRERLSPKRFTHSLNVASEAIRLARQHGADPNESYIAGLLHDCCKELDRESMLKTIGNSAIINDKIFLASYKIWHGFAAANLMQTELNIQNTAILDAVRVHSTGRAGMTMLDQILYLADLVSADRTYPGVEELRALCYRSLPAAMLSALSFLIADLARRGEAVYPGTLDAYNEFACSMREQAAGESGKTKT